MIENKDAFMDRIHSAAQFIKSRIGQVIPEICVVLGSGLAPLAERCEIETVLPYSEIPGFPVSTVPGHEGRLIVGSLEGKKIFMMSGRFHFYEGYDSSVCTLYVRVMAVLGVKTLVLTNAAGGLGDGMNPAELMAIEDHISFLCDSPLRGANLDEFGPRFPDQSCVYDREYLELLLSVAADASIKLHKGVYAYTKGPQYETPAEIRALKMLGASAVGMSTVPEAIVAAHSGLRVVAVSCITNMAAGISKEPLSHAEVMVNAGKASSSSCELVRRFIAAL